MSRAAIAYYFVISPLMVNSIFKFKQFSVDQSGCAMKINTDGVLLGAIADRDVEPLCVLDIGTGTGVIALMLAQRFAGAMIDAVEIDISAAACATNNALRSVFNERVKVFQSAIEDFSPDRHAGGGEYDLIVSNPPYFVNDLKSTDVRKGLARHADERFFEQMLRKVVELLSPAGCFWFILPVKQAESLIRQARLHGLSARVIVHLHSDAQKKEFRQIVCLDYGQTGEKGMSIPTEHKHLYIYESMGIYTDAYRALLKDFFLAF